MRFVLVGFNQKIVDDIQMPDDTPILDVIRMDNRYFVLDKKASSKPFDEFWFYQKSAYEWMEEIENKRVKH